MQTQNLTPETVAAILASPATKAALAEAEAGRTRERAELLRALAAAELAAAVAADEVSAQVGALQKAYAPLAAKANEALAALQAAEYAGSCASGAAEARMNGLRAKLRELGGGAIDAARHALTLERRIAENTLTWRQVTEPGMSGPVTRTEPAAGNADANALISEIDDALREVDALERDAGKGPAAIDARLAEMRADIEAAKAGAPIPKRGAFINPRSDVGSRRQVSTMTERAGR